MLHYIYDAFKSIINPPDGAQLANHANSTDPANAVLSNTAASYTTLGGRWRIATLTGAATDYALFAFQVPASGRQKLKIKEIAITAFNGGAAVATAPTVFDWSIGLLSTAVSLATAALRRLPLGTQSFAIGAAVGAPAEEIRRRFDPPLVAQPGTFVHVILQVPHANPTVSEFYRGDVFIDGYFD